MRSMMHATVLFLASFSAIQAQSPYLKPLPAFPAAQQSVLAPTAVVPNGDEMGDESAGKYFSLPSSQSTPEFIPHESGRPYSQLASYMNCNDWSPNTWNNYACERAAIASRISKHVDMRCSCFNCKQGLHASASTPGECSTGSCSLGCKPKLINRYKTPNSTLCNVASDPCSAGVCSVGGAINGSCSCQICQSGQGHVGTEMHPASASRPMAPMVSLPPRDRVASPVISNPRSAVQLQNSQITFQATR